MTATEPCEANRPLYGAFSRPAALARKSLIEERAAYRFRFGKRFGDQAYAAEELVAEIGAALLCAELRITQETRPDHEQYLARWLTLLKGDQRALFAASAKASEAAMYLSAAVPKSAAPPERADALISRVPLGKHEVVQALEIRAALPKTPVGKISKKDLCEQTQAISCFYLFARSAAAVAMYFE